MIPTLGLLVVLPIGGAIVAAVNASRGESAPKLSRDGSELTRRASEVRAPLRITRVPQSYAVTYRIERYDKTKIEVSSDAIEVRRPFESHVVGSAVGAGRAAERVTRFGVLGLVTGAGARTLVNPPAPPGSDLRPDRVVEDAVASDVLVVREQRRVQGRACQVYRAGSAVVAGDLVAVGSRPGEHADFCVDQAGLVLEEVWFKDGRPLQRRIATRVRENAALADERFVLPNEEAFPIDQGNGFIREVDPTSALEGPVWGLPATPEGFTYIGRFAVQPPQLSPFNADPLSEPRPREQISQMDVWQRGPDVLVLSQTIAADIAALPSTARNVVDLELPGLGAAQAVLDLRNNDVRVELPEARFLRLYGTLERPDLIALASTLQPGTGTGFKFL